MDFTDWAIIWNSTLQTGWLTWVLIRHYKTDHKAEETKCIRTGYDLYECPCKRCIELDIRRENKILKTA